MDFSDLDILDFASLYNVRDVFFAGLTYCGDGHDNEQLNQLMSQLEHEQRRAVSWATDNGLPNSTPTELELRKVITPEGMKSVYDFSRALRRSYADATQNLAILEQKSGNVRSSTWRTLLQKYIGTCKELLSCVEDMNNLLHDLLPPTPPAYHGPPVRSMQDQPRQAPASDAPSAVIDDNQSLSSDDKLVAMGLRTLYYKALEVIRLIASKTGDDEHSMVCQRLRTWGYCLFDSPSGLDKVLSSSQQNDVELTLYLQNAFIEFLVQEGIEVYKILLDPKFHASIDLDACQNDIRLLLLGNQSVLTAVYNGDVILSIPGQRWLDNEKDIYQDNASLDRQDMSEQISSQPDSKNERTLSDIVEDLFNMSSEIRATRQAWCLVRESSVLNTKSEGHLDHLTQSNTLLREARHLDEIQSEIATYSGYQSSSSFNVVSTTVKDVKDMLAAFDTSVQLGVPNYPSVNPAESSHKKPLQDLPYRPTERSGDG